MTLTKVIIIILVAALIITGISYVIRKPSNIFISLIRNFLGSFLIFSGFVKAIDPLGTSYKMHDYFVSFGGFFPKLDPLTTSMAVFMIVLEVVLGIVLVLGIYKRLTTYIAFALILFFTFLTGYTYLNGFINPKYFDKEYVTEQKVQGESVPLIVEFNKDNMKVTDCGCFGDFLKLDPKVSFFKDIFLLILIVILMFSLNKVTPLIESNLLSNIIIGLSIFFALVFCFSNYLTGLPMADFRPYKIGNNIREQMTPKKEAVTEFSFVYENQQTGEVGEFDLNNLPKSEEGWKFKERKEKVIDPGIPAKINNFMVMNEDGEEVNATLLEDESYNFWIVAYSLEKTKEKVFTEKLNDIAEKAQNEGYKVYALASDANDQFRHEVQAAYPFFAADATFLKTIIRSNPGLVLVKNGTVIHKWHHRNIPGFEEIKLEYLK